MADFIIGDYQYTIIDRENNYVRAQVVDKEQTSYEDIPEYVEYSENTYHVIELNRCFQGCEDMVASPKLPDSVTSLSDCFNGCISLVNSPKLPSLVEDMTSCFEDCFSLELPPEIPLLVTSLNKCFKNCRNMQYTPSIPPNVTNVIGCFENCTGFDFPLTFVVENDPGLNTIRIFDGVGSDDAEINIFIINNSEGGENWIHRVVESYGFVSLGHLSEGDSFVLRDYIYTVLNDESTSKELKIEAFNKNKESYNDIVSTIRITGTTLSYNVTNMDWCFYDCAFLKSFSSIPNTVVSMEGCFHSCPLLEYAPTLSNNITTLHYCFMYCSSLIEAPVIPDSVVDMQYSFYGCTSLEVAPVIPSNVMSMTSCFELCTSLITSPIFSNQVYFITHCFRGCTSLTTASKIPANVKEMEGCFYGCSSLTGEIVVENKPSPPYSNGIFELTNKLITLIIKNSEGQTFWKQVSSAYSNVDWVYYDSQASRYEDEDYYYEIFQEKWRAITKDKTKNSYKNIKSSIEQNQITSLDDCFKDCINLTQPPNLPNTITTMVNSFSGCSSLTTVTNIPYNVTNLFGCFKNCTSLTTVGDIPHDIINLDYCFHNCTSLVIMGDFPGESNHITNMNYCFCNCHELEYIPELYFEAYNFGEEAKKSLDISHCFEGCSKLSGTIKVRNRNGNISDTDIFKDACINSHVYLVRYMDGGLNPSNPEPWRGIADTNPNVHFEADDHSTPKLSLTVTRANSKGQTSTDGTYLYLNCSYEVLQDYLPGGWTARINTEELYIDSIDEANKIDKTDIDDKKLYDLSKIYGEDEEQILAQHTIIYRAQDNYNSGVDKWGIITVIVSRGLALLDFLGNQNPRSSYIDLPGMGMAIGTNAVRNGLNIEFPTTIGKKLMPPTTDVYSLTKDTEVNSETTYYIKEEAYNEDFYELTNDTVAVNGTTYYTYNSSDDDYYVMSVINGNPKELGLYIKKQRFIKSRYVEQTPQIGSNPNENGWYIKEEKKAVDLSNYQLIIGQYNKPDNELVFIIGNGTADDARSNAFTINWKGMAEVADRVKCKDMTENEVTTFITNLRS